MPKKDFTKATDAAADIFFKKSIPIDKKFKSLDEINLDEPEKINNNKQENILQLLADACDALDDDEETNGYKQEHIANNTIDSNIYKQTNNYKDAKHTNVTNKSKHYDQRGKREERCGLLLDKQLKEDLKHLANATGSKSVNDLIVTILLDYVEQPHNQTRLTQYKDILKR